MRGRLRNFIENAPLKLVAVVLFAILIPSLLVTALGVVAVFEADSFVHERFHADVRSKLEAVRAALRSTWRERVTLYEGHVRGTEARLPWLSELRRRDPFVKDVLMTRALLTGDGELEVVSEPPPRELWSPGQEKVLERLRKLEPQETTAALTEALKLLATSDEEGVLVEARLAAARLTQRLGQPGEALRHLREANDSYGATVDATGMVRALPILWRQIQIHMESDSPGHVSALARQLERALRRYAPHLSADVSRFYSERLRSINEVGVEAGRAGDAAARSAADVDLLEELRPLLRRPDGLAGAVPGDVLRASYSVRQGDRALDVVSLLAAGSGVVVHLLLDHDAIRAEVVRFCQEFELPVDGLTLARPTTGPRAAKGAALVSPALPPPLEHIELQYVPGPGQTPKGFRGFDVDFISLATFTWAVVVLVLTIVVGAFFTLRSVLRELHTARLKTDFVSFISHELKTPLTGIRMHAETLRDGRVTDEGERRICLDMLNRESERLSKLIDQLLEYSSIARNQKKFQFATCSMVDVVEEAVRLFGKHNPDDEREIEINAVQRISKILMDRAAMIELILNLLSNAAKYSRNDKKIVVNLRESIEDISVEVVDLGIGIRKRDQKKIFDKFYRAEDYLTREVDGTGLGLTFARYIAKVHNGDIKVSSHVNGGSTFTVQLRKTQVLAE